MSTRTKKLFLLDAMALIYRAHFAFSKNPRINSKGMNTGAVMGFTNVLLEIMHKEKPSHLGVAFDTSAPTFRHKAYAEYKANREAQPEEIRTAIPFCKDIVRGFNIPLLELDGFEADDIIGTFAKSASKDEFEVYMMTPDKDYAQLVDEHIFLYKPAFMGNGVEILGIPEVLAKFDIQNVDQVRDVLGLKGDAVDNIPGIPGVGDKTASKLLKEYGTVENIVAHASELKGALKTRVESFGQQGIFSKELATIMLEVPVPFVEEDLVLTEPNEPALTEIFEVLEFRTIAKRAFKKVEKEEKPKKETSQMGLFDGGGPSADESAPSSTFETIDTIKHTYTLVDTEEGRKQLIELMNASPSFCFDTETTSLETVDAEIVGLAVSLKTGTAYYVPFGADQAQTTIELKEFQALLEDPEKLKIGQNLKYDIQILRNYDISVKGPLFDTMLAHYLIDPETAHSMDRMAENYLNYSPVSISTLIGPKGKNQKSIRDAEIKEVCEYACEDADITLQLKEKLEPQIKELGLEKLLHEVEEPLSFVLSDMEYTGVSIDKEALAKMSVELEEASRIAQDEIFKTAGMEFNIGSPKQLGEVLFDKLKLVDKPKKTKSGQYATGEDILSKLAAEHDIANKILEFREYQKLKSTYVDALPRLISPTDGRVHTDYRQTVAVTGRLSSNNPNLQNIPIRTVKGREIRKAFVPQQKDHLLMAADYSQVELRIMAAFSGDQSMQEAFRAGRDIHANTASKVFKVPLEEVDGGMRRKAKEVNFGIIYGISAFGLSQNLNIPRGEASEIISAYFEEFPSVKSYMDSTIETARENEYVETILGRRRYLRNINSKNFTMRGFDERNAINAPIQGSAADIIKVAMINIHDWMKTEKLKSKMIMQVHDELVFEVPKEELALLQEKVQQMMQHAVSLEVPLEVEVGTGANWLEAH